MYQFFKQGVSRQKIKYNYFFIEEGFCSYRMIEGSRRQCTESCLFLWLGWAYRGLTGGFLLLQNFSVTISVNPHDCFYLSFNFDFYVSKIMHL